MEIESVYEPSDVSHEIVRELDRRRCLAGDPISEACEQLRNLLPILAHNMVDARMFKLGFI